MADKDKVTKYDYPSSTTGGVRPMNIRGLFDKETYRLSEEYNDEERAWRSQWLKDQELSPNEPRPMSQELIKEIRNPIRRFLSKPWQFMEDKMTPVVGKSAAQTFRFMTPKIMVMTALVYMAFYHLKYNQNDWTSAYGVRMYTPKITYLPGDKIPARQEKREPWDYADQGFKSRKVFLD